MRWWLKSCPKCHGDLYETYDHLKEHTYISVLNCLQCGRELDAVEDNKLRRSSRRHHNNKGYRQIKSGHVERQVRQIAQRLGVRYQP